jgi:hypothetical protein
LGKSLSASTGISFLRRTEYITTSHHIAGQARVDNSRSGRSPSKARERKRRFDASKEEPLQIAKGILKGFDLAYPEDAYRGADDATNIKGADITHQEKEAWAKPRHPHKPELKLLDSYPLLPDWDAYPAASADGPMGFATFKFLSNPVSTQDKYDERLDVSLLEFKTIPEDEQEKAKLHEAAFAKDPVNNKRYIPKVDYVFYMPESGASVRGVKRKFDMSDPDRDDDALYGNGAVDGEDDDDGLGLGDEKTAFRYNNVRMYETSQQQGNREDLFNVVALALHDPELENPDGDRLQKAAYFYPIMQRSQIRQKVRKNSIVMTGRRDEAEGQGEHIDAMDLMVRDPTAEEMDELKQSLMAYDPPVEA